MPTELATLEPLCQAAIITFKPFTHLFQISLFFLIAALVLKLLASLVKTKLNLETQINRSALPVPAQKLATKYQLPSKHLIILDTQSLVAFSSVLPGVANGIFLSQGLFKKLSESEREAVFLHELYHWQSKQTAYQLVLKLVADVFFFIPILKELIDYWLLESELAADAFAAQQLRSTLPLKQALSKWLNQPSPRYAWTIAFSETQLEKRIEALVQPQSRSKKIGGISLKGLSISVVVFTLLIMVGTSDYSKTEATLVIPTNSQCKRLWQQTHNQSNADAIMSPKIDQPSN